VTIHNVDEIVSPKLTIFFMLYNIPKTANQEDILIKITLVINVINQNFVRFARICFARDQH